MTLRQMIEARGTETYDIGPETAREPRDDGAPTGERVVTIDLDDASALDVLRAYQGLVTAGCYDVEARVSSSGNGAHVRGWIDADDADAEAVERIRLGCGDHARRTRMDRTHVLKPTNILFTKKGSREAGEWYPSPEPVIDELRLRSDHGPWGVCP